MYYSYVEIEYVATSFSPARTDLAVKLLRYVMCLRFWAIYNQLTHNSFHFTAFDSQNMQTV